MRHLKLFENFESDKVLFHGTDSIFTEFSEEYARNGWLGRGFYFTDEKSLAKKHGKIVMRVSVDLINPFVVRGESPSDAYTEVNKKYGVIDGDLSISLKDNGYDGVIFNHWDQGLIVTCFSPDQIKII